MAQSNAEKQAAYRERKRKELEEQDLPARDVDETPDRPVVADAPPEEHGLGISLEAYVEVVKQEAAAYADEIGEDDKPHKINEQVTVENRKSDRIARAERYARWRYQGVLNGEVTGL